MNYFLNTLDKLHDEVKAELSQKVIEGLEDTRTAKVYKGIRERMAHEKFVEAKHINIELFKYSMEIIDREENEEKEKKKPIMKKEPSMFETLTGI
jgi:regulator of RNase E activity RraB